MELIEVGNRIKAIRTELRFSQRAFAETLDINQSYLSQLERGANSMSIMILFHLKKNHNINPNWVLLGIGTKFIGNNTNELKPQESEEFKKLKEKNASLTEELAVATKERDDLIIEVMSLQRDLISCMKKHK